MTNTHDGADVTLADGTVRRFDRVVVTIPCPRVAALCPQLTDAERERLGRVVYQGIVCASLLLKRPLAGYYVTNITDAWVPFTAVIEMTALVDRARFGGNSLVYLPRYLAQDDPVWARTDDEVREEFLAALERMYPAFRRDDVLAFQVSRVRDVLAVSTLDYSTAALPARPHVAVECLHRQLGADRERDAQRQRDHRARERTGIVPRTHVQRPAGRAGRSRTAPRSGVRCMTSSTRLASVSLDLDNLWSYLKTHGDAGWEAGRRISRRSSPSCSMLLEREQLQDHVLRRGCRRRDRQEHGPALRALVQHGHEVGNHSFEHEPWLAPMIVRGSRTRSRAPRLRSSRPRDGVPSDSAARDTRGARSCSSSE